MWNNEINGDSEIGKSHEIEGNWISDLCSLVRFTCGNSSRFQLK